MINSKRKTAKSSEMCSGIKGSGEARFEEIKTGGQGRKKRQGKEN